MTIIDKYQDNAQKWRYTVQITNERAIFLKFQEEVSDETAFAEAQKILDIEEQQRIEQEYLAQLLAEEQQLLEELGDENY